MALRPDGVGLTVLLGALAALPPLGIDMGLPALGLVERQFAAPPGMAGQTLSLFLAGFALAQLVLGPLSDRLGRRPVLLAGLALFTASGLACTAAPTLPTLILARLLQGAGAAAGTVMAFAVTRDLFEGDRARAKLSYVALVLSVAPIIAPTLGGWVLPLAGWRGIYGALAVCGVALLVATAIGLGETRGPDAGRLSVLGSYRAALRHRGVLAAALVNALNFGCMFAWVSGSAGLLMGVLGAGPSLFGALFATAAGAIMAGAWISGRLAERRVPGSVPLVWGMAGQAASAAALVILLVAAPPSLMLLMPVLVAGTFCRGLVAPNATHLALEPLPHLAGVVAAMVGALQMAVGAAASALVAALVPRLGPLGMALVMLGCASAAPLAAWWGAGYAGRQREAA